MTSLLSTLAPRRLATGHPLSASALAQAAERIARTALDSIFAWRERARARRDLASMDERLRRDIGLSRFDVLREVNKPFWRA